MQRDRPPGIFVTQPALSVHVPVFVCSLHEGWCSRAQTPTSCCVNPAPPVAQSGTAPAIHTSSVGKSLLGLTKPFYISHTPSHNQTTITSFIRSQRHHIGPIRVLYHSVYTRLWKHSMEIKHIIWRNIIVEHWGFSVNWNKLERLQVCLMTKKKTIIHPLWALQKP